MRGSTVSQSDTHKSIYSLSDCLTDISLRMKSSKLKLNSDKTEFISIGTKLQRHKLSNHFPVKLLDNDICPSDSVRNLGVVFDSDFSFHKHVSSICQACCYHIRDLRRIRRHIHLSTAKTISNALISSSPDYCNSLLNNIAKQDLSKLQRVQDYNNNNKQIYLQPHRVGFTYTVIYKQNKIQGNKIRRNVIRKVIHTAMQRDTQSDTYFH